MVWDDHLNKMRTTLGKVFEK